MFQVKVASARLLLALQKVWTPEAHHRLPTEAKRKSLDTTAQYNNGNLLEIGRVLVVTIKSIGAFFTIIASRRTHDLNLRPWI